MPDAVEDVADSILDLTALSRLLLGDQQLQQAVLAEFKRSADPYLGELDIAVAAQDREGVRSLAHKLKSSSRTIGAAALSEQCGILENGADEASWERIQALQLRLQLLMMKVIAVIDEQASE